MCCFVNCRLRLQPIRVLASWWTWRRQADRSSSRSSSVDPRTPASSRIKWQSRAKWHQPRQRRIRQRTFLYIRNLYRFVPVAFMSLNVLSFNLIRTTYLVKQCRDVAKKSCVSLKSVDLCLPPTQDKLRPCLLFCTYDWIKPRTSLWFIHLPTYLYCAS